MSSTFKYHSQVDEVVPWQATYTFPTQATKVSKQTVKLVPKNGATFSASNIVRIEFPADNYLNVLNSVLQFDVQWNIQNSTLGSSSYVAGCGICVFTAATPTGDSYQTTFTTPTASTGTLSTSPHQYDGWTMVRTRTVGSTTVQSYTVIVSHTGTSAPVFTYATPLDSAILSSDIITLIPPFALQRGGAQNFIKRLRVLYGSLVLEDILEYKTLVRMFFEAGVNPTFVRNGGSVLEGMYGSREVETSATVSQNEMNNAYQVYVAGSTAITSPEVITGRLQGIAGPVQGQFLNQLQCSPAVDATGAVVALGSIGADQFEGRQTYCLNLLSGLFTQKKLVNSFTFFLL